jgi:hypothetical protein
VTMFWMIVGAISVPLVYGFLRTQKFYDGVLIVAPGYMVQQPKLYSDCSLQYLLPTHW